MSSYDTYINTIDVIEESIVDDAKFPVVRDTKLKQLFRLILEFMKDTINYLKFYINATKKEK